MHTMHDFIDVFLVFFIKIMSNVTEHKLNIKENTLINIWHAKGSNWHDSGLV